ncbi:hypothetical protein [Micromonospora sp. GCM10011541]|uniref:hypothetical protein n=1 Tax=Micromonospora sp. GCM10011541 TaxID=3317336 RepID=UPI00360C2284
MSENLLDNETPGELVLALDDGGQVELRRIRGAGRWPGAGRFTMTVTGSEVVKVKLARTDLLTIVAHVAKLLAEDEVRG